ncbi:membrane protein [Azorhizobium oxalatiphilum]|uniref:Membrane protein n=1 Tax=Azorhizobium oxalatiphilum TaxID=980631 RepID=A0A917FGB5_9HYPH|nr:O-antigen ligase family protein [Azorhizobium oxalatiphilum]GGF79744.1 membrane protein [Azorhizobium oxalatiphilum]
MTESSYSSAGQPASTGYKRETHWMQIIVALLATGFIFYFWMSKPGLELPLMLAGGSVLVVLAFKRPSVPCIIFVCFSFLRIHEAFPALSELRIPQLLAQLTIIVMFWHLVLMRTVKPIWSVEMTAFAVFFFFVTASMFISTGRDLSYKFWSDTFLKVGIMTLLIAWTTRKAADFQLAMQTIIIGGIAVSCVALYNKVNGIGLVEGTRVTIGRAEGSVLGDPNDLALALLFPLGFAGALASGRTSFLNRLLGLIGFGFVVAAIIATQSRGGLLGMATVVAVLGSRFVKNKLLLFGGGGAAMVLLYIVAGIAGRSSGGAAEAGIDESAQGRLNAWTTAWNMAKAHPLLGVGVNTFPANYFFYTEDWDGHEHAVHSTWFGVLAETGFLGFSAFITMVGLLLKRSWKCLKAIEEPGTDPRLVIIAYALAASLASFCVAGTFLTQGLAWPLYVILAMTVSLWRLLSAQEEVVTVVPTRLPEVPPVGPSATVVPLARPGE